MNPSYAVKSNPEIDYRKKWYVMAAVAMGVFLSTIDGSIVNIALPTLVKELGQPLAIVEWVVLAYLLTVTTLMIGMGRLADMIGKKPLYVAGFVIFTAGSALCGSSATVGMLVGFRVFQAVGASMMMALGTAIVTEAFPSEERGKALGIIGLMVSIGVIAGPTIGGIILEHLTWNWLFFVNIPVGLVGIPMVLRFVPAIRPKGHQRFDYWGAVLLLVSLCSFLLALSIGEEIGYAKPVILGMFGLFAVTLALFVRVEKTTPEPMIDTTLFRNGWFSVNLVTGFMTFVASAGTILLLPFFLQDVIGLSPRTTGLLMAVNPIAIGVLGTISGALSDRIGSRKLTTLGLFFQILGYWLISGITQNTPLFELVMRALPMGIGLGIFQSPNNSAVMGAAPRERLGVVSGMLSISRTLGQMVGISILSAVWAMKTTRNYLLGIILLNQAEAVGFQQTTGLLVFWIAAAFLLSFWTLMQERKAAKTQPAGEMM
ncbi:drug resistance transporter, EmrB/QacA subfamily [Longilinea arvoryzae]|uniref:Drug resistance transporter, EmrB/QacA subfamily n=1 Tax=Longilinea arvoryzae TaxID=360412 RepID=A0A0S7BAW1_9CHLR|nr:MFS transporter [Longilinea arvoryzae]GAP14670.1 drug resistance transporter, EmrB/QacA subfamily [Longilinea arvoryzae]